MFAFLIYYPIQLKLFVVTLLHIHISFYFFEVFDQFDLLFTLIKDIWISYNILTMSIF
jgi:hypothetical protein